MKILSKVNFTLKEIINSESATKVIKDFAGHELAVTGFLIGEKEDVDSETGELKNVKIGVIKTQDGELISSISPTVIGSIDTIINVYTEANLIGEIESGIPLIVKSNKSAKKREFYNLELK